MEQGNGLAVGTGVVPYQLAEEAGDGPLQNRHQPLGRGVVVGQGFAKAQAALEIVKGGHVLLPGLGRGQGKGQVGDDAGQAATVDDPLHLFRVGDGENAGYLLDGDDGHGQHIARVPEGSPRHRADAPRAAGQKAARGGGHQCAGEEAQFPADFPGGCLDTFENHARFHPGRCGRQLQNAGHLAGVDNHPALHRDALAVVARGRALGGDGNPLGDGRDHHLHQLLYRTGPHDQLGGFVVQQGFEDRRIPVVVPRVVLQTGWGGDDLLRADDCADVIDKCGR